MYLEVGQLWNKEYLLGKEWKKSFKGHCESCCPRDVEKEQGAGGSEDGFVGESPNLGLKPQMLGRSKLSGGCWRLGSGQGLG